MKRLRTLAAALLLAAVCCIAKPQNDLSAAVDRIATTRVFAFSGIGYAGRTSQGEIDFRIILSQPPAVALERFEKIFATGNAQAKCYALVGIRHLNEKRSKELLQSLRSSKQTVTTQEGCIREDRALADVAEEIDLGMYEARTDSRR